MIDRDSARSECRVVIPEILRRIVADRDVLLVRMIVVILYVYVRVKFK